MGEFLLRDAASVAELSNAQAKFDERRMLSHPVTLSGMMVISPPTIRIILPSVDEQS